MLRQVSSLCDPLTSNNFQFGKARVRMTNSRFRRLHPSPPALILVMNGIKTGKYRPEVIVTVIARDITTESPSPRDVIISGTQ